jgi:hypothetical protein
LLMPTRCWAGALSKAIAQATAAEEVAFDDLGEGPAVVLIHARRG